MFTDSQKARLKCLHEYGWFDEGDPADLIVQKKAQLIGAIESREELFYASMVTAWDLEEQDHRLLLEHSLCDFGLALHFYWRCQPDFYYRMEEKKKEFQDSSRRIGRKFGRLRQG